MSAAGLLALIRRRTPSTALDADLVKAYAERRDAEAFRQLVEQHGPLVLGLCRRRLGDPQDADDAFQATFLLLVRRVASVRRPEALAAWLYGTAWRVCNKALAARARRRRAEARAAVRVVPDPADELSARELLAVLDEALARLPKRDRLPLLLVYWQGRTHAEAAARLGLTKGALHGRLERGRRRLADALQRRGLSPVDYRPLLMVRPATAVPRELLTRTLALTVPGAKVPVTVLSLAAGLVPGKAMLGLSLAALIAATSAFLGVEAPRSTESSKADWPRRMVSRLDAAGDRLPEVAVQRLGTLRFRQGGGHVHCLLRCPDRQSLVSASYYGEQSVCVWDLATGRLLREFPGNFDDGRYLALSADGKTLAVPRGPEIALWDVASGRSAGLLKGAANDVVCGLAFAPDGRSLAAGDRSGVVQLWDLATGQPAYRLAGERGGASLLAYTPDGTTLVAADHMGTRVSLWDVAMRKIRHRIVRPTFVHQLALSPDGRALALGAQDGIVTLWDVASGQLARELKGWTHARAVAFAPDGGTLAVGEFSEGMFGAVSLWDVAAGTHSRRIQGLPELVEAVVFSADGRTVISGGRAGVLRRWDVATGEERPPTEDGKARVACLTVAPNGRLAAFADGGNIRLWDLAAGQNLGTLPGTPLGVRSLAFTPDGRTLAAGPIGNAIGLWDVGARKQLHGLDGDAKNANIAYGQFNALAFAPDGRTIASAGNDGAVRLWDSRTGRELRRLPLQGVTEIQEAAESVAISPDGRLLVGVGAKRGGRVVRIWETATGHELSHATGSMNASMEENPASLGRSEWKPVFRQVRFAPDGRSLVMSGRHRDLVVWETATGGERCRLRGHEHSTAGVAFAPDGRTLASAGWDGTVRLWDLDTGAELAKLTGHRGRVNSLGFAAQGRTLVSAGDDTTVLVWEVAAWTGRPRQQVDRRTDREWDTLWENLAVTDPAVAYRAVVTLAAAPGPAALLLGERLRPIPAADRKRLAELVAALDSVRFAERQAAFGELANFGDAAAPVLRQALATRPSAEVTRAAQQLLDGLECGALPPDVVRGVRAVEVLEKIATEKAQDILARLATGEPAARLTVEAKASLDRLRHR